MQSDTEKLKLTAGEVYTLKVVRESELGAFLDAQTGNTSDDILLHKAQQTAAVKIGDEVKVYLYLDPRKRLTASMKLPKVQMGQIARLEVINTTKDGAFVDIGAERGVFLPFSQMHQKVSVGQKILVKLYRDKSGRQAVTMKIEDDLQRLSKPAEGVNTGDTMTGFVYNIIPDGYFLFSREKHILFLHKKEAQGQSITFGQEVSGRVTFVREDGRINISLRQLKHVAMHEDAENILQFMRARGGSMPYSDQTAPEIIMEKFHISKAAFKRALGGLLKEGLIEQKDGWTMIANKDEEK